MFTLRKIWLLIALTFFILVGIAFGIISYKYKTAPLTTTTSLITIKVQPGTGSAALVRHLQQKGLIDSPWVWKYLVAFTTLGNDLKAGEYEIKPGMSLSTLVENMTNGDVYLREMTLVEGWPYQTFKQVLAREPNLKQVLSHLDQTEMMKILGSQQSSPEGLLFPDTYFYTWGDSDLDIIKQAYGKMHQVINQLWPGRAKDLPYQTAYQGVIVASLIEKETAVAAERPIVASVIVNRLRQHMRLQIDPTVMYGLGDFEGRPLTHADLKHYTPYNTYLVYGLPPTPIAMPSEASIKAALHPAQTNYLYYVAKGDGTHQFTTTYGEHLEAVRKYRSSKSVKANREKKRQDSASGLCQFSENSAKVDNLWYLLQDLIKNKQPIKKYTVANNR